MFCLEKIVSLACNVFVINVRLHRDMFDVRFAIL